mgnify:CR=1 FL=1
MDETIIIESFGGKRVRLEFNSSNDAEVEAIKRSTAYSINLVEKLKEKDPRLAALAQIAYEEAAMWAVKLATTK